jgi:hypothetical protein
MIRGGHLRISQEERRPIAAGLDPRWSPLAFLLGMASGCSFMTVAALSVLAACAHAALPNSAPLLDIAFADDATFRVSVGGLHWLESAPIRAFMDGTWQENLTRSGTTHSSGADTLGTFSCVNVSWVGGEGQVLHTSLKTYAGSDMAIFVQQLPGGAQGTNASNPVLPQGVRVMDPGAYPPVVAFPSMAGGRLPTLGFVTWQSRMINVEYGVNVTGGPAGSNEPLITGRGLQGLSTSGPVVLYDEDFVSLLVDSPCSPLVMLQL